MKLEQTWIEQFNQLDVAGPDYLREGIRLLQKLQDSAIESQGRLFAVINQLIIELDQYLSKQLSLIIQQDKFQSLESLWRGMYSLAHLPVNYSRIKIRFLDASWADVSADINLASTIKHSELYQKIANRELNTLGGEPFGVVLINHYLSFEIGIDDDYDDLYTTELLGRLGELCLCPILLAPDTEFFGDNGADWFSDIQRVDKVIHGPDFDTWQRLRRHESSRFVGLPMPRIRLRNAYSQQCIGFFFEESYRKDPGLWGSAGFAFLSTAIREFNRIGWFGFLKSRWNDKHQGSVINLPEKPGNPPHLIKPKPRIRLFGKLSSYYADQGFIPLSHSPLTGKYFFENNNSVWFSRENDDDRVLAQIQTTLICCRIAHYLKVQIREMLGSYKTADECERHLQRWVEKFTSNLAYADENLLAQYPIEAASINVSELESAPGAFGCELRIKPQYQYDNFSGEIVLKTDLGEVA